MQEYVVKLISLFTLSFLCMKSMNVIKINEKYEKYLIELNVRLHIYIVKFFSFRCVCGIDENI